MKPDSRTNRVAFRRAVWASVMLHVLVAGTLVLILRAGEKPSYSERGIDTRADEPQVRISVMEDATVSIEEPSTPAKPQAAIPAAIPEVPQAAKPETPAMPSKPFAQTVPQTLPPELVAILRKPVATPTSTQNPPASDPNIRPAGGVPGTNANTGTPAGGAPAIHGALAPGKTVVYVLDASGSMGAAGKFDAARAALVSTLHQQPATVRFQIIVYAGTAAPLLTSDGHGLLANEANVRLAAEKLAAMEARGRSDHLAAVRAALAFQPDVILMLTDADDLSAATMKPILASSPKPVLVCVGQVAAEGVQRPRELK